MKQNKFKKIKMEKKTNQQKLSLLGILLRWGFLIWEFFLFIADSLSSSW